MLCSTSDTGSSTASTDDDSFLETFLYILVPIAVFLICCFLVVFCVLRRKRKKKEKEAAEKRKENRTAQSENLLATEAGNTETAEASNEYGQKSGEKKENEKRRSSFFRRSASKDRPAPIRVNSEEEMAPINSPQMEAGNIEAFEDREDYDNFRVDEVPRPAFHFETNREDINNRPSKSESGLYDSPPREGEGETSTAGFHATQSSEGGIPWKTTGGETVRVEDV